MKKKTFLQLFGWLAASGTVSSSLSACAENSTSSATQTQAIAKPETVLPSSSGPATTAVVSSSTVTQNPAATPTPEIISTPSITLPPSTTPPVATATVAPTNPPPTSAPTPTRQPAFTPVIRLVSPAHSGYYFSFAANGGLVFYAKPPDGTQPGSWVMTFSNLAWNFITPGFGNFTPDLTLAALTDKTAGTTVITELATNKTLATLQNRASSTIFSPDKKMIAYLLRSLQQAGPEEPQRFDLWVANVDGSQARSVWTGLEASNLAWFPDSQKLLWTGRDETNKRFGLWSKSIVQSDKTQPYVTTVIDSKGITAASLSGDGKWIAYWVMLQGSQFSGVWLARSDGSQAKKLDWMGGFRWADTGDLLYVPVRPEKETTSALWSFQPTTSQTTRLTDPAQLPLRIALDQWQVAPGSKSIVFRNASNNENSLHQLTFRP